MQPSSVRRAAGPGLLMPVQSEEEEEEESLLFVPDLRLMHALFGEGEHRGVAAPSKTSPPISLFPKRSLSLTATDSISCDWLQFKAMK
ncbi:hypothetical protein NQZ68_028755 [Dissostichus eleginoides]|nr:hypothetical protein NQZ68_028755 [Dissostichus eleginoides]